MITVERIASVLFTSRRFRRGYDEREVDDFLDEVAAYVDDTEAYIVRLEAEVASLRNVPRSGRLEVLRPEVPAGPPGVSAVSPGPGHSWSRGALPPGRTTYPELAPDALAASVPLPSVDDGSQRDVPESAGPATSPRGTDAQAYGGGLGHPSPYGGNLTPAQRRRDKHKQRGQWAPLEPGHWYADGLHFIADWQAEWHAEAAAFDGWLPGYLADMRASLVPAWSRFEQMVSPL